MKKFNVLILSAGLVISLNSCVQKAGQNTSKVWSKEKAEQWYAQQKWITGCNFIPSNAINELEMWQKESFDPVIIDRELGYAERIGFNTMRVFLHYLPWEQDSTGFLNRIDRYLAISDRHKIKTMFVFFDNCWRPDFQLGKQPDPTPFRHNSGWLQCPGSILLKDTVNYSKLTGYVKGIMRRLKNDKRVLIWDMYNEPVNSETDIYPKTELPEKEKYHNTMLLIDKAFKAARETEPSQPLTAAVIKGNFTNPKKIDPMEKLMLDNSDIITFHNYGTLDKFKAYVEMLKTFNRPFFCSEYMARTNGSTFQTILPYCRENKIGAINWGLVMGKTNTIYPWDSWKKQYTEEPKVWFHDVFRPVGTPFDKNETELIKKLNND